jgi:hypothetical protein
VKTKKTGSGETSMNRSSHQSHEKFDPEFPYRVAILSIFRPNPMIGIAADGDLS